MEKSAEPQFYYFTVQGKDPEVHTYSCVAQSAEHARRKAKFCGHNELLLLEVRPLEGFEVPDFARESAIANPLVGEDWLPLVDFMAGNLGLHRVGRTWVMNVFDHRDPLESNQPYAQAVLDPDGTCRLEVGPTPLLREFAEGNGDIAQLLGWSPPRDSHMPNYFQVVPAGYSIEWVAATAIQALTVLFGVTTQDGFSLSKHSPHPVSGIDPIDPGPDYVFSFPVFGISGLHKVRIPRLVDCSEI